MDIYKILSSKTHNSHHLSRYIKFIKNLENQSFQENEFTEIHHICPKAKDLFPEYENPTDKENLHKNSKSYFSGIYIPRRGGNNKYTQYKKLLWNLFSKQ